MIQEMFYLLAASLEICLGLGGEPGTLRPTDLAKSWVKL